MDRQAVSTWAANLGRRGEVDVDSETFSEDDRDGEDEKELERDRDSQLKRDMCTFNLVILRATC